MRRDVIARMLRASLASLLLAGCTLYQADPHAGVDAGVDPSRCPPHTLTIFEPADGATVATHMTVRVRWNEAGVPDRYTSMQDDFGNYFIGSGSEVVNGDGSITMPYDLPAGGSFTFEAGWICDAGNDGPEVVLGKIRIHTAP
jgi:hypothetical protein